MDTTNSPDPNLPAKLPAAGSRLPASYRPSVPGVALAGPSAPSSGSVSPKTLIRGLSRHWWHILGLSILCSAPLVYLIHSFVEPKFEAQGLLRVEPTKPNLYTANIAAGEKGFAENYLRTQLELIGGKEVLAMAANDPLASVFPLIKESEDPLTDLKKALSVEAIKDTFLIRVSLRSRDAKESYEIVKAVIRSYMEQVKLYGQTSTVKTINQVKEEAQKLKIEIDAATAELIRLTAKGHIQPVRKPADADAPKGEAKNEIRSDSVTENRYAELKNEYIDVSMKLDAAEALLKKRTEESDPSKNADSLEQEQAIADAELGQQIEAEFRADPEVKAILDELATREKEAKRVKGIARRNGDPALKSHTAEIIALEEQYKRLWDSKYDSIRKRILAGTPGTPGTPGSYETIQQLQQRVASLQAEKEIADRYLKSLEIENQEGRVDAVKAELAQKRLEVMNNRLVHIDDFLRQATFESGSEEVRVTIADPVREPITPAVNTRTKLMAIAPVAVLGMFLGLFLLLEIKAERVSDPDSLSTRVQSEVFALPPLPSAREVRKMRQLENGSDQIDRFIQRLDHLRFAVCGSQTALDNGRCVLITSAVGGEGKTTLAAQLAARCGNAGMSTLLIDADLRRASLGKLLDVPDGPGLGDVLKGEITVEEAAVPVQGGTFHLLLAGSPIDDVSRVLHGANFGILIAQLRELYDLIVIDSPPVLPVPDALILGQWVDGAILASRFDVSRFPQVERARRQLDLAGITVLGTVINGMRSSDSYYGHYSYSRKKGSPPDASNAN